jgi:coenzyme F420-0:L-glutamate ligase/coenzyme F420-1:gamma-L-glutamate ligase
LTITPVTGLPEIREGDDLVALIGDALDAAGVSPADGDVFVVASKIVSKAEGQRLLTDVEADAEVRRVAARTGQPLAEVAAVLAETATVLRAEPGVLVVETRHGYICANAGVDRSNTGMPGTALLLPADPDAGAARIQAGLEARYGASLAVLVSDTFGRPFRYGLVNVALGVAGMRPIRDYRGQPHPEGRPLAGTELAVADELCAAAELVMNKLDRVPVAMIHGYRFEPGDGSGRELLRDRATDYFR